MRTEIKETRAATAAMRAAISRADAMLEKLAEHVTPVVSLVSLDWGHLACSITAQASMSSPRLTLVLLCLECLAFQLWMPLQE